MAPVMPSFATLKLWRPVNAVRSDGNDPDAKLLLLTSNALSTAQEDRHDMDTQRSLAPTTNSTQPPRIASTGATINHQSSISQSLIQHRLPGLR